MRAGPGTRRAIELLRLGGLLSLGNLLGKKLLLGNRKILARQAGSRKEGFYATKFSAVTPVPRAFVFCGPWKWIMSPLSADAIKSSQDPSFDNDPTADAGAQNRCKHHPTTSTGAVCASEIARQLASFSSRTGCPKASARSRSNGLPLIATLFELRSRPVCGDRRRGWLFQHWQKRQSVPVRCGPVRQWFVRSQNNHQLEWARAA